MCEWGDTVDLEVTIPASLSHTGQERWAVKPIDRCIAPIIQALNQAGITTIASCCGHGGGPGAIALADGRELITVQETGSSRPAPVWNGAVEILVAAKGVPVAHRFNAFALAVAAFIQTDGTLTVVGSAAPTGDDHDD